MNTNGAKIFKFISNNRFVGKEFFFLFLNFLWKIGVRPILKIHELVGHNSHEKSFSEVLCVLMSVKAAGDFFVIKI